MIDIQNSADTREIPLEKVGVKGVRYPVTVLDKAHGTQQTTATADLFVNLPHDFKGTHMSRFIETFHDYRDNLGMKQFLKMLSQLRRVLNAERSFAELRFPFFIEKHAPVTGRSGMMSYDCAYGGEDSAEGSKFWVSAKVPVTTLCPCSKAISERGAHNQRGIVTVKVENTAFFWLEDVIAAVENAASCSLYSVLKREDEKFVTEKAYDNPRFVEDMVREVYLALKSFRAEKPFSAFSVECENFESIHNHNAYAFAEYTQSI